MTPRAVVIVAYLAFLALLSSLCQAFTAAAISAGLLLSHSARKILSVSLFQVVMDDRVVFCLSLHDYILQVRPTVCVSRWWAGWDSLREQKKPEARKMPVSRDESHQSAARFVRRFRVAPDSLPLNQNHDYLDHILQPTCPLATPKFDLPKDTTTEAKKIT
jgi:hypothetical protein